MPRVPTTERQVATAPLPGVGLRADTSAAPPSKALEAGVGLAADIVQAETKKANQIATLEADTQRSMFETELLHDPETGALNTLGKNALGIYQPTMEAYDKKVGEISASLSNDTQRLAFNNLSAGRRVSIDKQLQQHGSKETLRYDNEVTQAWLANGLVTTSENYENAEAVSIYVAESKAVLTDHAKRNGWSAEKLKLEKTEQESKTHKTVIAQMLADGDDLAANEYFKKHDKNIIDDADLKGKLSNASTEGEAARLATDSWGRLGPTTDIDAAESDKMVDDIRKKTKDPEILDAATTNILQRVNLHNASAQERTNANLSAVWGAYNGDTETPAAPLSQILTMPEYQALSGTDQKDVKNSIARTEKAIDREDKEAQRVEQEIRREELKDDMATLRDADLELELREGLISRGGYLSLKRLLDPKKSPSARAAFKRLDDSKTKKLFNPRDINDNEKQWVEFTQMLHDFIEANPEGDPAEFVNEIMQPVDVGITEKFLDIFSFGMPGTERAIEERQEELRGLAEPTRKQPLDVREGRTATNSKTGEKLIFKDGTWQKLTK